MPITRRDFERGFVMDWPPSLRAVMTVLFEHRDQAFTIEELRQEVMNLPAEFHGWIHSEGFDASRGGSERLRAVLMIILDMLKRTGYIDEKEISWPISGGTNVGPVMHYTLQSGIGRLPWMDNDPPATPPRVRPLRTSGRRGR
jgi:hypothetical protein